MEFWRKCVSAREILLLPSVQRRKVWLTPNTGVPCSNAAKTQKPLKFAGVPQTNEMISAGVHHIVRTCAGDIAA